MQIIALVVTGYSNLIEGDVLNILLKTVCKKAVYLLYRSRWHYKRVRSIYIAQGKAVSRLNLSIIFVLVRDVLRLYHT